MKIKFNGMFQTMQSGCIPCGRKGTTKKSFSSSKSVILPSGNQKIFHRGEEVEVSDLDGEWLLSWTETESGMERHIFTRVD